MMSRSSLFRRPVAYLAGLLGMFPALLAAQGAPPDDGLSLRFANGIAAIVEGKVITVDDIRREISQLIPQLQRESRNEQEFNMRLEALQDDVIQQLIDRELIVKEFYSDEKRRIPASYVDNMMAEELISQFEGDRSKFLAYLRQRGITHREYRREIEEQIIFSYMRSQHRRAHNVISPVQVQAFYDENRERFYQDDAVHLRLIQFNRAPGETDEDLRRKVNMVHARLQAGETFAAIARDMSDDSRRNRGGDWGWQARTDLREEFSNPLFELKAGQASDAIIQGDAAFVLYAEERRYAGIQDINDVREIIERELAAQLTRQAQERWLERLRRNGYVRLF
jgi:peptidyl-prolyl cis-trans isomerase SurA